MTVALFCRVVTVSSPPAIEVDDLVKSYGEVEAVRGVSFAVPPGEVFGFLGPNGAGKSTTINMLCTLAKPTSGAARVNGFDVVTQRDDVRRHIGLVFQDPTLDVYLTAEQNLRFHAELYGIDPGAIGARMDQMLARVDLADRRDKPVITFSGGMKRRLEIARGLMHSPRVLFLDEPTIGLDPQTRSSIWRYIRALQEAEGTTNSSITAVVSDRKTSRTDLPGGRSVRSATSRLRPSSRPANARSSFVAKWLNTVFSETSAAAAISATVTVSKPRSANSRRAVAAMASRATRFLRARRPSGCAPNVIVSL